MPLADGLQDTRHTAGPLHWQYHDWSAVLLGCVVISRRIGRSTDEDNCMFIVLNCTSYQAPWKRNTYFASLSLRVPPAHHKRCVLSWFSNRISIHQFLSAHLPILVEIFRTVFEWSILLNVLFTILLSIFLPKIAAIVQLKRLLETLERRKCPRQKCFHFLPCFEFWVFWALASLRMQVACAFTCAPSAICTRLLPFRHIVSIDRKF
jgi:hypothetical protein